MRAIVAAAILSICLVAQAAAQTIPTDEVGFTAYVAKRMQRALKLTVQIKEPLTLSIGKTQAYLDRIHEYCKQDAAGCPREIEAYVKATAKLAVAKDVQPRRGAVRAVVRSARYLQQAEALRKQGASPLHTWRLAEGLAVVAVLDLPEAVKMLTEADSKLLGLNSAQTRELALANLRKNLKRLMQVAKPVEQGKIGSLAGDVFQPSRLALLESWAPLADAQRGVLIVVAPTTDSVLFTSDASLAALDSLRTLAKNMMSRAPNPLSDILLQWTPAGWKVIPPGRAALRRGGPATG